MRIVGGELRGARLAAPSGQGTRPTSDRVRESLFNILAHSISDFSLQGARVLDLFAGSGALGLEALSRGAAFALFVEHASEARGAISENIDRLGLMGRTRLFRRDATRLGASGRLGRFDLVFLDPPYGQGLGPKALAAAQEGGWLQNGAVCVVEEAAQGDFLPPHGFDELDRRIYGNTQVIFMRAP